MLPARSTKVTMPQAARASTRPRPIQTNSTAASAPPNAAVRYSSPCLRTSGTSLPTTSRISPPKVPVTTPMMTTMTGLNPPARATATPAGTATDRAKASSHSSRR